jgi:transposase
VSQALAQRARIVLGCAEGRLNRDVARDEAFTIQTVGKWRQRFLELRLDGLTNLPRPNIDRKLSDDTVSELIRTTLQQKPEGSTHWSTRKLAKKVGVTQSSVSRVWRAFKLMPHRTHTFCLSTDDFFVEKVRDCAENHGNPADDAAIPHARSLLRNRFSLRLFPSTKRLLAAMAVEASMGDSESPNHGSSAPAASGMRAAL